MTIAQLNVSIKSDWEGFVLTKVGDIIETFLWSVSVDWWSRVLTDMNFESKLSYISTHITSFDLNKL